MAIEQESFHYVRDLVYRSAGIVVDLDKEYLVESRLRSLVREEGFASIEDLVSRAKKVPVNGLHHKVVEAMTTNETFFFRDTHPFQALKDDLLPKLAGPYGPSGQIVIWCAACSTGQEPYSIAMVVREHFPDLAGRTTILATDLSTEVTDRAKEGLYRQIEVNRGLPASYLVKYFEKVDLNWKIKSSITSMVEFSNVNLLERWPDFPPIHIVFLRNVLIYFDVATKRGILANMRRVMAPGAALFMGAAETTLNLDSAFERVESGNAVYYQSNGREP